MRKREAIREAKKRGKEAGENAASWIIDGNTTVEQARAIVDDGIEEIPSWLSGEWAGESISELLGDLLEETCEDVHDDILTAYEDAATDAFSTRVYKDALKVIPAPLDVEKFPPNAHYAHPDFSGIALYISRQTRDGVMVIMVGDDREHEVDADDLTVIAPTDFCRDCGQIGCSCNVYE